MDTRSKLDVIYQDALRDVREILDRVDELKAGLPAEAALLVEQLKNKADDLLQISSEFEEKVTALKTGLERSIDGVVDQIGARTVDIGRGLDKSVDKAIARIETQTGILANAADQLRQKSSETVEQEIQKALPDLHNAVRVKTVGAIEASVGEELKKLVAALDKAVSNITFVAQEARDSAKTEINNSVGAIRSEARALKNVVDLAHNAAKVDFYQRIYTVVGVTILSSALTLGVAWFALSHGMIPVNVFINQPVAQTR